MAEESTRTKIIKESKVDDDMPMVKKAVRSMTLGASQLADKLGFTQEKEYSDKSKEELIKKRKGGKVKAMKRKTRRYADGGLAGIADSANSLMGEVKGFADKLNYGDSGNASSTQQPGFLSLRKGGKVKMKSGGYRKVADGIATKGKTKGRMV